MKEYLHPDVSVEWNSSKGFVQLDYDGIVDISEELGLCAIKDTSHIISENDMITVRYSHFVKR
jgi:hypothetical protein